MFIKLKIFFKILLSEIGIKGLILLVVFTAFVGIGKDLDKFYFTSALPAIIFIGFLFEFSINNKLFLMQLLYLPNSVNYIKIFSILWSFIYSVYVVLLYVLFHHQISLEILIVVSQIFFISYFCASYILLRSYYTVTLGLVAISSLYFFDTFISLFLNSGIILLSFLPIKNTNLSFAKSNSKLRSNNYTIGDFTKYQINSSNYIVKFLIFTINRNNVHSTVIKLLIVVLLISMFFNISILNQDINYLVFHFSVFLIPVLLILISTYCLILIKNIRWQDQFKDNLKDIFSQLSKIYYTSFYILLSLVLISIFFFGIEITNILKLVYIFLSMSLFAHASFLFLFISEKYIQNFMVILLIGLISSILPGLYKLIFTSTIFILFFVYINRKIAKLDYA